VNRTRRSRSIPARLLREGKGHLLPLYFVLRTSDLAREGIDHSGSYRFADHIYAGKASGQWGIGPLLDRLLLRFPSARSFRSRYVHARESIVRFVQRDEDQAPLCIASVPCGIARELADAASRLRDLASARLGSVEWTGIDLDPVPLHLSGQLMASRGVTAFDAMRRDVLQGLQLQTRQHVITSTGLGEFLTDAQLTAFYADCRASLRAGGWLVTSATRRHPFSDYLLQTFGELETHYREREQLISVLQAAGFERVYARPDAIGLQTLAVAVA
jgi:hypothetical protein